MKPFALMFASLLGCGVAVCAFARWSGPHGLPFELRMWENKPIVSLVSTEPFSVFDAVPCRDDYETTGLYFIVDRPAVTIVPTRSLRAVLATGIHVYGECITSDLPTPATVGEPSSVHWRMHTCFLAGRYRHEPARCFLTAAADLVSR